MIQYQIMGFNEGIIVALHEDNIIHPKLALQIFTSVKTGFNGMCTYCLHEINLCAVTRQVPMGYYAYSELPG